MTYKDRTRGWCPSHSPSTATAQMLSRCLCPFQSDLVAGLLVVMAKTKARS